MVEKVSARPLSQNSGGSALIQNPEPGTELRGKVEANLPGGVVRLDTGGQKINLQVFTTRETALS